MNILRRALTLLIAAFAFITIQFGNTNIQPAFADNTVVSPEGVYYKGTPDDSIHKNLKQNSYDSDTNRNKQNNGIKGENYKNNADETEFYRTKVDDGTVGQQARNKSQSSDGTVVSPEGVYYKGVPDDDVHKSIRENSYESATKNYNTSSGNIIEEIKEKIEETAETVTEKLNLNEETPRATKEFLRTTEKQVEKAVEPVTGTRSGYYQIP
ncbi:hypothetical protein DSM106972_041060 [Dulcicalothrix desertica PCC 7102]|uniref:Uncharacterized protein n=1 Tax=Dulcicalothrix desertica PCC 7102 TaxID=232991 RepID=A0A433VGU0_9CYAN|nr:hypothetical protein [Dulcicalothrix desertica]RUT05285.1 hypothetical protein DSM106972_041060 [Dulcicalothrix desertica PCC 7102]TWH43214.1 hypothetical protein CAL7102_06919 [Dulcicalothrix desertica PCC 7102]